MKENELMKDKTQGFNDKIKQMHEKLELSKQQKIIAIDFKNEMNLGGDLKRNSVFVLTIQNKDGEINHIIIDRDINKIADIDKYGKIELSPREMQLWEKFIGEKGKQNVEQKKIYDYEKEYYLQEYKTKEEKELSNSKENKNGKNDNNKNKEKNETPENKEKKEAAEALKTDESEIKAMIKIEDRETFGQAINKKLYADAYIVKYGNNKTKIMQVGSNGKLRELSGIESSEFNSEVMEQLNINKAKDNQTIKAGDLTTIKTENPKYNYIVVREHDSQKRNSNCKFNKSN